MNLYDIMIYDLTEQCKHICCIDLHFGRYTQSPMFSPFFLKLLILFQWLLIFFRKFFAWKIQLKSNHVTNEHQDLELSGQGIVGCTPIPTYPYGKSRTISPISRGYLWFFSSPRIPRLNTSYSKYHGIRTRRVSRGPPPVLVP